MHIRGNSKSMKATEKGLRIVVNATGLSSQDFRMIFKHEEAFRQEFVLVVL